MCLGGIALVLAFEPDWPLRLSGPVWWAVIVMAVAGYLALRRPLVR